VTAGGTLTCSSAICECEWEFEYTREARAIDVTGSIRSGRVKDVLARLISVHGAPRYLRSDNGSEFLSRKILKWLAEEKIETALIDPGKSWQNGTNESFNGKFRDDQRRVEPGHQRRVVATLRSLVKSSRRSLRSLAHS
jgi:transposase InsO family protein